MDWSKDWNPIYIYIMCEINEQIYAMKLHELRMHVFRKVGNFFQKTDHKTTYQVLRSECGRTWFSIQTSKRKLIKHYEYLRIIEPLHHPVHPYPCMSKGWMRMHINYVKPHRDFQSSLFGMLLLSVKSMCLPRKSAKKLKSSYCIWVLEHVQDPDVLNSIFAEKAPLW